IYTPGGPAAQLIEDAMKIGEEPSSAAKDTTANQTPDYTIPGTIDSIYINRKGKIVVIDTEGNKSTYDQKKEDGRKGKAKDTIIADAAGNSYTVGADGKIEKTTGGKAQPASVMASLSVKERIVVIVIDQFDGEMAAWLRNNGKGGDIDDDLLLASELPACFKRDAGQLKYFRDKILPYYKEHPSELVDKIEADAGNRELFDKVAGHFSDASSVDWSKVPADEQEDFRNATGLALMDRIAPLVQFYDKAAPSLQTDDYKKWLAKVQAIYNYFKTCSNEGWESYQNEGIIPYCFWRDQKVPEAAYYSNADIPFTAGLIDGAYREAEGIYQLPELVRNVSRFPGRLVYAYTLAYWECRPEKLIANAEEYEYVLEQLAVMDEEGGLWNWLKEQWYNYKEQQQSLEKYFSDCHDANNLREGIDELYDIATNWNEITKLYSQVSQRISEYFNTLETADNIGRYERGRLVVPAVSTALTLGAGAATKVERIKNVLKSLRKASEGSWKKVTEGFGKFVAKGAGKYWRTATEMRDEVMAWAKAYRGKLPQTRQLDKFNKACAASYQKADGTIETVFGRNGGVLNTQATYPTMSAEKGLGLHPELAKRLPEKSMWPNTANCAECDAVNQALHNGAKWEDIQIHTIDIRPDGTMTDVIQCLDCQNILKNMYVTSQ
ncbi:MAG TPA: hypothetical protein VIM75_24580, partial [Ohtaekwangia sp.]|uniref:hypothetical protein n=1 Tax=Ohtaekwangia sp. TaxID=2066019 RepID=UPI002F954419